MAEKKMSNRQRMINMMYLVLLALLALNVSVEILPAINNLRIRLQSSALNAQEDGMEAISNIRLLIADQIEKEKKNDNQGLLDTLNLIQTESKELLSMIDRHISDMEGIAVYDEEKKRYRRMDEMEDNFQYWMGDDEQANDGRGNGEAFSLRNKMEQYGNFIATLYNHEKGDRAEKMASVMVEDPQYGIDASSKKKSWERFTFDGPVIGNMATLEALKIDVLQRQQQLLDIYQDRFNNEKNLVADSVIAISSPVSRIVTAGLPFRTQLSVGLVSSMVQPGFSSPNGNISLENGGNTAWLQIMANGGLIPDGKTEAMQSYSATVEVPLTDGTKKRMTVTENFTVRKPEIQITSAAVQLLYRNCGNAINIDVPALGDYYDPQITATQAQVTQSRNQKIKFLVVPTGKTTQVKVQSKTNGQLVEIGTVNYRVVEPPKPLFDIILNRNESYRPGMEVNGGMSAYLRLTPDKEFKEMLPQDAKYEIGAIEISIKDRIGPPSKLKTIDFSGRDATTRALKVGIPSVVNQAPRNTHIYFKVTKIYRKNYLGQRIEDTRFSEQERTFSFVKK